MSGYDNSQSINANNFSMKSDPAMVRGLIEPPSPNLVQETAGSKVQNNDYTTLTSKFTTSNLLRGYGNRRSGVTMAMNGFASQAKAPLRMNTTLYATASDDI